MPLENLYAESDRTARRWRTSVGLIFFAVAVYFIAAFVYFQYFYKPENRKRLEAARREQSVYALCREIDSQLPSGINYMPGTKLSADHGTTTVVFHYNSVTAAEEVKLQYLKVAEIRFIDWLRKMGWRSSGDNDSIFKRGSQTIRLRENPNDFANFELLCSETQTSFDLF